MATPWIVLFVALWLIVIGLVVMTLGLSGQLAAMQSSLRASREVSGSSTAAIAPGTPVPDKARHVVGLPSADPAICRSLLLFLGTGCGRCANLADALKHLTLPEQGSGTEIVLITDGDGAELFGHVGRAIIDDAGLLADSLGVPGTPFGVVVDSTGIVKRVGLPRSVEDVRALLVEPIPSGAELDVVAVLPPLPAAAGSA
jgi:hypothetical protein